MKQLLAVLLFILYALTPSAGFAQRGHYSHSHSYSSHPSSRPYYGGGHHTRSHGGSYGVSGSSHRGGHYTSHSGSHHYGRHK